ncbi:MAG: hypothetical protein GEU93_09260 [Propionibacteriales bacterium]|nr:hypothetical protein [Propionibacteriales bacterium]
MAIPYVQECQDAMSRMSGAISAMRSALTEVENNFGDETWRGSLADDLETDFQGVATTLRRELQTAEDNRSACMAKAQRMQAESANPQAN